MTTVSFGTRVVATAVTILAPSLGDAAGLGIPSDHEAGDVLQEQQRDAALVAQLDEVRALLRRLAEQHAVVGDDADRMPVDAGEAGDERLAVLALELVELAAVDESRDDLAHVVGLVHVDRHDAVELGRRRRRARPARRPPTPARAGGGSVATMSRTISSACSSSSARWSTTPERRAWSSPPPSSSAVTISPIAAFTSGGPPRKIVPWLRTITVSSLIAGT